jgi:hypothetical protein
MRAGGIEDILVAALPSSRKYFTFEQNTAMHTGAWAMNLP